MRYDKIEVLIDDRVGAKVTFVVDGIRREYSNPDQWLIIELIYQATEDYKEMDFDMRASVNLIERTPRLTSKQIQNAIRWAMKNGYSDLEVEGEMKVISVSFRPNHLAWLKRMGNVSSELRKIVRDWEGR